jgi:hypothetical protein
MAEQSIVVTFHTEVAEEYQALVVELDDEMNDDKTQFLYGEKAYFRIFKYPPSLSITIFKSDGTITSEGSGDSEEEDTITFVNTDEGAVSKPVKNITSYEWLGNSLGSVSAVGTKVKASQSGVAVLKLKYKSNFVRHAISVSTKEEEIYPVVVFIIGE